MPGFTRNILHKDESYQFEFNRVYTIEGGRYHVSVRKEGIAHYFMMYLESGKWYLSQALQQSQWIIELENKLSDAILEH
jgi:hypothetical protein